MNSSVLTYDRRQIANGLVQLGGGGQGIVYGSTYLSRNGAVYKEYKPELRADINVGALERAVAFFDLLSPHDAQVFLALLAWPLALVTDRDAVIGFLMPEVPVQFSREFLLPPDGRRETRLCHVDVLFGSKQWQRNRGLLVSQSELSTLTLEIARAVAFLHRYQIAIGDLSHKNLLFSLAPYPAWFFIDCDSMTIRGHSVLPQFETRAWSVSTTSGEQSGTLESDIRKLGLLCLRMFANSPSTRNTDSLPPETPQPLRKLISRSLEAYGATRPSAQVWVATLEGRPTGKPWRLQVEEYRARRPPAPNVEETRDVNLPSKDKDVSSSAPLSPDAGAVTPDKLTVDSRSTTQPPVAHFACWTNGLELTVDSSSTVNRSGAPLMFNWEWGDGSFTSHVTSPVQSHTYKRAAAYPVTLTARSPGGPPGAIAKLVRVQASEGLRAAERT